MSFPLQDPYWSEVRSFLEQYAKPTHAILAPNEFLEFFPSTYPYNITHTLAARQFDFIALHKGMLADVHPSLAADILSRFWLVLANDVFAVFAKHPPVRKMPLQDSYVESLLKKMAIAYETQQDYSIAKNCAIVVLTCNTPHHLERSLPQLLSLGAAAIVVDNGSSAELHPVNQQVCARYGIPLLYTQRGTPNAINMGIEHWLADPSITWMSYIQDGVEVHPNWLSILAQIQDPKERPLLTGRDASEHPTVDSITVSGHPVLLKRSVPGIHFHAHRTYWANVLPIPTPDLSANGMSGRGTEEDWWITAWSPQSIVKRGGYVAVVPGLVRTFAEAEAGVAWSTTVQEPPVVQSAVARSSAGVETIETMESVVPERSPLHQNSMPAWDGDLRQVKVLVDGYNLQMTSGTGIKTYSTSLIKALKTLGATVDVLLSRNASKVNDVLDEVLFFDNQNRSGGLVRDVIDVTKGLVKTSLGPLYKAKRRKKPGNLVVKQGKYNQDFLQYAESFNLPQCYDVANVLYKKLHYTSNFHISEKIDIWHATYPLPITIRGTKKITTMHDLIPLRLPYATLDDKENFYYKVRDSIKDSSVIISVSEHSKQDLLTYFDADPDKIVVTYQPIALEYEELDDWQVKDFLKRYGLGYQKYILFVGAIEPKKNVGRLLDAYATLDTDMTLVIVGKKGWLWEDEIGKVSFLFDKESKKQVKLLEYVPVNSLKYLYRGAYCLVFPSLYEGFGLPPLEAMTFGCPVITSRTSSLPEVCGNAALYVDPYDVGDIRTRMETLLGDRELRDQLSEMGYENAAFFSMENYIQRLYSAYTKALQ